MKSLQTFLAIKRCKGTKNRKVTKQSRSSIYKLAHICATRGILVKRPIAAATSHHGITALIGRSKYTHPLTPGKKQSQQKMVMSHLLAIGRTGAKKNATNGHLGNEKATAMQIAAINVDVMTTVTVPTVGAKGDVPGCKSITGGWEWRQSQIIGSP